MNDLVRLACERAVKDFGDKGDGLFNGAGFSCALMKLARLNGVVDGELVRVILAGRDDVDPQPDGSYYKLLSSPQPRVASTADGKPVTVAELLAKANGHAATLQELAALKSNLRRFAEEMRRYRPCAAVVAVDSLGHYADRLEQLASGTADDRPCDAYSSLKAAEREIGALKAELLTERHMRAEALRARETLLEVMRAINKWHQCGAG